MKAADSDPAAAANLPGALLTALRRLVRPLVRLLLDHRITWPTLATLFRSSYVEMADREFGIEGKPQTTARVSLLTGIHRKEVRRLRGAGGASEPAAPAASLGAQLVARWTSDPRYLATDGHPLRLARRGEEPSFESLVESVSKDIRSRAVLDEWFRLGVIEADADDHIILNQNAFVPERGFEEKAFFFGRNLRDHIAAAAHNLRGEAAPLLERSVFCDELSPESVAELEALARDLGESAIGEVNRRAFALQQRDEAEASSAKATGVDSVRMTFGVFFYRGEGERDDK